MKTEVCFGIKTSMEGEAQENVILLENLGIVKKNKSVVVSRVTDASPSPQECRQENRRPDLARRSRNVSGKCDSKNIAGVAAVNIVTE